MTSNLISPVETCDEFDEVFEIFIETPGTYSKIVLVSVKEHFRRMEKIEKEACKGRRETSATYVGGFLWKIVIDKMVEKASKVNLLCWKLAQKQICWKQK